MEGIEIPIGADVKGFQKGVSEVEDLLKGLTSKSEQLKNEFTKNAQASLDLTNTINNLKSSFDKGEISAEKFESELKTLNLQQKDLGKESRKLASEIRLVNNQSTALGGGMQKAGKSTANAVPAVTEFSRVIQDAPYGMQGVANNLQQLTANFGHLKASAGGTIPALKAMLSSLAGPAGILLAVSAVTSAIVYFGAKSRKAGNDVASLKEQQDKLKESMDNYVLSLEAVNRANLKGEQSAAKELVNLSLLKAQVNDTTLSLNRRKDAVAELRKLYPDYLKNMTDEKILNGGLATVYDTLTGSIKERARATASMNAIIKNTENILVLESQRAAVSKQLADEEARVNLEMQKINKVASNNPMAGLAKSGVNASSKLLELRKNLNSIKGEIQSLELTNIDLEGNVKTNQGISGIAESIIPKDTQEKVRNKVAKLKTDLGLQVQGIQDVFNLTPINVLGSTLTQFDIQAMEMQTRMLEFANSMKEISDTSLTNAFIGIGDAIGGALANGGNVLQAIGMSLLRSFGSFLSQMGAQMILYGKLAVAKGKLDLAIAAGGPVAIAAGAASIKIGILAAAAGAAVSALASGGFGGARSGTNAGSSSGSSGGGFTGGFSGSSGSQRVVFEIAGRKLIGVIQNEIRAQGNSGVNFAF